MRRGSRHPFPGGDGQRDNGQTVRHVGTVGWLSGERRTLKMTTIPTAAAAAATVPVPAVPLATG